MVGWPNYCRTVSNKASWRVSHVSCVCSTGWARRRCTTLGGKVLEMRAHATCRPAVSPSSLSGSTAIFRRSLATASATSRRWSWMKASLPKTYLRKQVSLGPKTLHYAKFWAQNATKTKCGKYSGKFVKLVFCAIIPVCCRDF